MNSTTDTAALAAEDAALTPTCAHCCYEVTPDSTVCPACAILFGAAPTELLPTVIEPQIT